MNLTPGMITIDTSQPMELARWWARQLGREVMDPAQGQFGFVPPAQGDVSPALGFQRDDNPTPGKNRIHIDFHTSNRAATVQGLVADGATLVAEHQMGDESWTVLADPDGNQFCVAQQSEH